MIQKTNARLGNTSAGVRPPTSAAGLSVWGSWCGRHFYTIEVVQNPVRARMCGFGDKDRRPLAPAAVCRMIVKREDNSIVDEDEIDTSFFLVTVDLWSEDGTQEMNLVLHPSSQERIINSYVPNPAKRRKGSADSPPIAIALPYNARTGDSQSNSMTSAPAAQNGSLNSQYNYQQSPAPLQERSQPITFHHHTPSYNTPDPAPAWNHHSPQPPTQLNGNGNGNGYTQALPSIHSFERQPPAPAPPPPPPVGGESSWHADGSANIPPTTYRAWSAEGGYAPVNHAPVSQNGAGASASSNSTYAQAPQNGSWSHSSSEPPNQSRYAQDSYSHMPLSGSTNHYDSGSTTAYSSAPYTSQQQSPHQQPPPQPTQAPSNPAYYPNSNYAVHNAASGGATRQAYTRTLVGPLSANACRLNDEHRKPGIFFLFQDLSIRTEGSFRLRLRLMNVGAPPAPEARSLSTHVDQSPILAQTFTEPFMVFSAKRFPGVPDTTALSISFGSQGQKLPLRNRHGKSRKRRRGDDSDGSDDEDGA